MRDRGQRGMGSKHFESRDNVGPWRSEADEFSSYHTDFDLQVALELDESQGLYDDQEYERAQHDMYARAEYDRRAYNYQTPLPAPARATSAAARATTPQRSAPARATSAAARATAPQRLATNAAPAHATSAAARATMPQRLATNAAPRRSLNASQLAAAQAAPSGIRNTASAHRSAQLPRVAPSHPSLRPSAAQPAPQRSRAGLPMQPPAAQTAQRSRAGLPMQPPAAQTAQLTRFTAAHPSMQRQAPAPKLTVQPRAAAPMRMLVDDEPLEYPSAGRGRWLGKLAIVLLLAGAGFAAHTYVGMQAAQKPVPVLPPPAATVSAPAPEPAPEPAPAAAPEPVPAAPPPPLTAQERRAAARAARAAMYAERRREREEARAARVEARRARVEARAGEAEAPKHAKPESDAAPALSTSRSWKTDDADKDSAKAADKADTDLLAPADDSDEVTAEPAQPKRAAMADTGLLRINSRPWSVIFVDGHPVGHTPQMNLMLPAGEHEITLVNDEMQLRKTLTIDLAPGTTTTRTLNLAE